MVLNSAEKTWLDYYELFFLLCFSAYIKQFKSSIRLQWLFDEMGVSLIEKTTLFQNKCVNIEI